MRGRRTQLGDLLNVGGDVVAGAGGSESAWERDEDDLLVGELLGAVVVDGDAADPGISRQSVIEIS